jgi:endonuclease YncB( thermonuclease family)
MKVLGHLPPPQFWQILGLLTGLALLIGCNQPVSLERGSGQVGSESAATLVLPTRAPTIAPTPLSTRVLSVDSLTPEPTATITPIPAEVLGFVVQVLAGDVIAVVLDGDPPGRAYEVRYLGIEAPANQPSEAWGAVAYETNRRLTRLKVVRLVADGPEQDEAGRLLRHVYVDNTLLSLALVEQGLARATAGQANRFAGEITTAEAQARTNQLGLWSNSRPTATAPRASATAEAEGEATTEAAEPTAEPAGTTTPTPGLTPTALATDEETTTPTATTEADPTPTTTPAGN